MIGVGSDKNTTQRDSWYDNTSQQMQMVGQFSPYKNTVFEYFLTNYLSLKNRKLINIGRSHRSQQSLWTLAVEDRSRVESLAMLISPLPPLCVLETIFLFSFSSLLFYTLCVLESVIMMSQTMMTMAMMSKRRRTMRILMNTEDLRMESYKMRTLPIFECFILSSYWIETLQEFDRIES